MCFIAIVLSLQDGWSQNAGATNGLRSFDGNWWVRTNSDERLGFLYALDDCLTYDARPVSWFDDTWANYEQQISDYYRTPSHRTTSVQGVFERFGAKGKPTKHVESGARYGDEFWRSHNDTSRSGFIEGYISCRIIYENAPRWSRPVNYYLGKVNDMYNADDKHGENAAEYEGSVASALEKLRDRQ